MWEKIKKFAPFAVLIGYALVYMNKGWDRVLVDLKGITVERLQAKWQHLVIAAIAAAGIYFIAKVKMPAAFKALVMLFLYFFIGYQVAVAIDPPNGNSPQYHRYTGNERNRYALGR